MPTQKALHSAPFFSLLFNLVIFLTILAEKNHHPFKYIEMILVKIKENQTYKFIKAVKTITTKKRRRIKFPTSIY